MRIVNGIMLKVKDRDLIKDRKVQQIGLLHEKIVQLTKFNEEFLKFMEQKKPKMSTEMETRVYENIILQKELITLLLKVMGVIK